MSGVPRDLSGSAPGWVEWSHGQSDPDVVLGNLAHSKGMKLDDL